MGPDAVTGDQRTPVMSPRANGRVSTPSAEVCAVNWKFTGGAFRECLRIPGAPGETYVNRPTVTKRGAPTRKAFTGLTSSIRTVTSDTSPELFHRPPI
ncbi:hypothetical protein GCM10009741_60610 [Kribbella lupini]|uniref:Uncharacterized protein n=1 Tax=Kribbella lupini TaxID=291602 RepID=A0ABN2BYB9_9ACTN